MTSSELQDNCTIGKIGKHRSSIRRLFQKEKKFETDAPSNDNSGTTNTSSPVNKRRGFNSRKWLPPPLRKLSQGKVEKPQQQQQVPIADRPPLKKTGSDKRIKVPAEMGNKPSVSEGEEDEDRLSNKQCRPAAGQNQQQELANGGGGDDADEEVELPPPMKPIQEPILVTAVPPIVPGIPSIEEKSKREQHSENQERNSLVRDAKSLDTLTECAEGGVTNPTVAAGNNNNQELSVHCPSAGEAAGTALSGDESDKATESTGPDTGVKSVEVQIRKRHFVLKELYETEKAYVKNLELIVHGYMKVMRDPDSGIAMPDDLKDGKDRMVFGNIEAIYDFHNITFSKALERCVEDPAELGQLFKRYERKLHMYVVYCKNKPVSEYIVSEYLDTYFEELRIKLGHKLQICDLLIKPIQRIMKYQLLLRDILKYTERAGIAGEIDNLRGALEVMTVVPQAANDMMDVGRLQGFDGKITAQGKLLLHGPLVCSEPSTSSYGIGKNKECQVFLFEQSIIFSEAVGRKTQFTSPQYFYKGHFQINKMKILESNPAECTFTLGSLDPQKPNQEVICQAPSLELFNQWVPTVENILQTQADFLKAIQHPIAYQNKLTKDSVNVSPRWSPVARRSASVSASTPTSPTSPDPPPQRNTVPIHKTRTIDIPLDPDGGGGGGHQPENAKHSRKSIFSGLRRKHKNDAVADKTNDKNDMQRSWCDNGQTPVS